MTIFSEEELLVLANIVGVTELFGVPRLHVYRLNQTITVPKGIEQLEEKGLLVSGSLTKKGFLVATLIERYAQAQQFICLGETYYVAVNSEAAVVLKKEKSGYQLTIQEPDALLGQWLTEYVILRRSAEEEEMNFRVRRARISLEELEAQEVEAALLIGLLNREQEKLEKVEYQFILSENVLYRRERQSLKRVSQYWLNKWLVDQLKIKYVVPKELKRDW